MALHRPHWMNEELDAVGGLARTFFTKECAPHEERWAQQQHVDRDVWRTAGSQGLLCASIPDQFGGGGGDLRHDIVIVREQHRALAPSFGAMLHSGIIAHYVATYGTDDQRRAWLPGMASGDLVAAIAMTEPGAGSDLQGVKTKAVKEGSEYVINGSKTFISNGMLADLVLVVCRTDASAGSRGISIIVVETTNPGFRRGRNLRKIGMHGQDTCELFFDDVRVPEGNLLGGVEGQGFVQLMQQLPQERLLVGVTALACMETALELTVEYTRQRTAFGKQIFDFQNSQFVLAECATAVEVGWSFLDACIEDQLAGRLDSRRAAMAKWWLSEQQNTVIDRCLQLFGGYGYMEEYPIARLFTDARIQKIYGGTNEIMKQIIARSL